MKKTMILLVVLLTFGMLAGCTTGSGVRVGAVESNSFTKMSMSYEKFTGYRQAHITVQDEPVTVVVEFVSESGDLDAYIARDNDIENASYSGNNVETASFTVTLHDPGDYTVRVDADDHKGSYSFTWGDD